MTRLFAHARLVRVLLLSLTTARLLTRITYVACAFFVVDHLFFVLCTRGRECELMGALLAGR